jgi:hypothetical protein
LAFIWISSGVPLEAFLLAASVEEAERSLPLAGVARIPLRFRLFEYPSQVISCFLVYVIPGALSCDTKAKFLKQNDAIRATPKINIKQAAMFRNEVSQLRHAPGLST